MSRKIAAIVLVGAALVLTATACGSLPGSLAQATSTPVPTLTPYPTPAATSAPAPQGNGNLRARAIQGSANLLKGAGLNGGGVVTSNSGSTLGVTLGKASRQIQVASNAIVIVPGKANATVSDIQVGDRVIADVNNNSASFVLDVPAGYTAKNLALAAVQSNQGRTLRLRTRAGTRDVTTSAATMVVNISGSQPALGSLADLKLGAAVLVIGNGSSASFDAQVIVLLDKDMRNLLPGRGKQNAPAATPTPGG
ncbi:MAG: hypothetical protein KGJ80_15385 [Chloroflexota bacterium]|nr:hypothetical protein [Chloroflexota bacterium]